MPTLPLVSSQNERLGEIALSDRVFGGRVNEHLLWEAGRQALATRRAGTVKVKTRAEVSGAGRKLWRQKGTGRARIGSIRSPLWRHGGTVHGPVPRSYDYKMPKKAHHGAMRSALAQKAAEGALVLVADLPATRTKEVDRLLARLGVEGTGLLVTADRDPGLELAVRNHPRAKTAAAHTLSVFDVLRHAKLVLTQDAAKKLEEVYGR